MDRRSSRFRGATGFDRLHHVTTALANDVALERAAPGWRTLWTPSRARLWLIAGAAAAYLPALGVPLRGWLDFSSFYAAGALAFTPQVAQLAPIVQFQVERGLPPTPFVYPAGVALLYAPLAALPYPVAAALHMALMVAALIAAAVWGARLLGLPRSWTILGTLAWGPAAAGAISGRTPAWPSCWLSPAPPPSLAAGTRSAAPQPASWPTSPSWERRSSASCCFEADGARSQPSPAWSPCSTSRA